MKKIRQANFNKNCKNIKHGSMPAKTKILTDRSNHNKINFKDNISLFNHYSAKECLHALI